MTPADMRARADWLHKWCEEKTTPAMLRAGADAIEEVERLRSQRDKAIELAEKAQDRAIAASALTATKETKDD